MKKLASDVTHRVFDALSKQDENNTIKVFDKNTFIRSFLEGKSESKWGKAIKKQKVNLGRELKVKFKGAEKIFLTFHIFEKPISLRLTTTGQYFSADKMHISEKYLFRHAFDFERINLCHPVNKDNLFLNDFRKSDKLNDLSKIKDEVIKELAHKFVSNDVKIIETLKEVISEKFDEFISNQTAGQAKILDNQSKIMENQTKGQADLMQSIAEIKIKIEQPQTGNAILKQELEVTKKLLEEERKARVQSRMMRSTEQGKETLKITNTTLKCNQGMHQILIATEKHFQLLPTKGC